MGSDRIYSKRMGITHAEFFRLLPVALGMDTYTRGPNTVSWSVNGASGEITLGQEGVRQIALLTVPSTAVTISLTGYNDSAVAAFMRRFDRAYQRGGG